MSENLLICSTCRGSGRVGLGKCLACDGLGVGLWFEGKFLYWNKQLTSHELKKQKFVKFLKLILNFLILLGCLSAFLFLVWRVSKIGASVFSFSFWTSGEPAVLFFLFSLLGDLYLVYQFKKEAGLKGLVEKKEYKIKKIEVPEITNWAEIKRLNKKIKIDVFRTLSSEAAKTVESAWHLAQELGHSEILPLHLFGALIFSRKAAVLFGRLGVNLKLVQEKIANQLSLVKKSSEEIIEPVFSFDFISLFFEAYKEAYDARREQIDVAELILSIAKKEKNIAEILYDLEVNFDKLKNVVEWIRISELLRKRWKESRALARLRPKGPMSRAMTALATPYLDRFSQDLTLLAKYGYLALCIDREKEIDEIFRVIEGGRQSVILVGPPGIGKTTIVEGIAERMLEENVPKILQDKRLVSLNIGELVAGATPSEVQERFLIICDEIARAGNIVLYIPNIEGMVGIRAGEEESIDLSRVLADELARGYFFCFASTTPINYSQHIEMSALGNVLQKVEISEPEVNQAIQILEAKAGGIEYQNKVFFSYDALELAVTLSSRYMHEHYLPEKAIEIIKEAAHLTRNKRGENSIVKKEDVAEIIAEKTKVPVTAVTEEESEKLLRLEDEMHKKVIGQNEAVQAVARALRRARAELREAKRPIANFLFLGPTGVGKTETAKTVAEVYFGSEKNMIRLDMSEYQDPVSLYKLIGVPGGAPGGYLTEAVRKNPFTLLLLDEFEKAHPDVLNIFLQVMDDGRLTDNVGRTIDFTNIILIATSNAGTPYIQEGISQGLSLEEIKEHLIKVELKPYFKPELLNRFDGIIVFKPLTMAEIEQITSLMLDKIAKQLEDKRGIILKATPEAVSELARAGFDPIFGARPLRRVIAEKVEDVLTELILKQRLGRRDVVILEAGGVMRVEKAREL